jgi:hypothetical protein
MRRAIAFMIVAGALAAGSAGCSSAPLPQSSTLTADAQTLLAAAHGVRVTGSELIKGELYQLNLAMNSAGDYTGTLSIDSQTFWLTSVGNITYELVTRQFYTEMVAGGATVSCASVCGRYLSMPGTPLFSLAQITTLYDRTIAGENFDVSLTTYDGKPAYKLTGKDNSAGYIAATGSHYLLGVRQGRETLNFTDWNDIAPIAAPPSGQVVRLPARG